MILAANQLQMGHKGEFETNSLSIKTCFHSMAKKNLKKKESPIPYRLKFASNH